MLENLNKLKFQNPKAQIHDLICSGTIKPEGLLPERNLSGALQEMSYHLYAFTNFSKNHKPY